MRQTLFKRIILVILAVFLVFALSSCTALDSTKTPAKSDGVLTAMFLDIGQGDCELFYLPDGKVLLIDAGDNATDDDLISYLSEQKITKIDYLIATHPHADHIGGMSEVINSFDIGQVFAPKIASADIPTTKTYEDFLTSVQNKGLKLTAARSGTTLFEGEDYKAECFAPNSDNYDELNNYSVVIKLTYGIHSFLLTGDAEALSEDEMIAAGHDLSCDVLKIGHHGSSTSSSKEFLVATAPKYAVISCGTDNKYGHPHDETVTALDELEALKKTFRTDNDKTVIFSCDGKTDEGLTYTVGNPSVIKEEE